MDFTEREEREEGEGSQDIQTQQIVFTLTSELDEEQRMDAETEMDVVLPDKTDGLVGELVGGIEWCGFTGGRGYSAHGCRG